MTRGIYKALLSKHYFLNANGDDDDEKDIVDVDGITAEVNTEINFLNTGGTAATTAVGGSAVTIVAPAAKTGLAATKFAAAVPVIGQVVAVVATAVAIGQVFHNTDKINQYKALLAATNDTLADQQQTLAIDMAEHNKRIDILKTEIEYRQQQIDRTELMNTIVLVTLGVAGLVFVYGIARLRKK